VTAIFNPSDSLTHSVRGKNAISLQQPSITTPETATIRDPAKQTSVEQVSSHCS
jgi:hypothetical protein